MSDQNLGVRMIADKLGITPEQLIEKFWKTEPAEDPGMRRIKQLVGKAEPAFPPARLKSLQTLMVRIAMFHRIEDMLLLRQQSVLEEAIAAHLRGESLSYLNGG